MKFFPRVHWVRVADDALRVDSEIAARLGRRRFLQACGVASAYGLAAISGPTLLQGCETCEDDPDNFLCELRDIAFKVVESLFDRYGSGENVQACTTFDSRSGRLETFQMLSELRSEMTPDNPMGTIRDDDVLQVAVPAQAQDFMFFYDSLTTDVAGSYDLRNLVAGAERVSELFLIE